MQVSIAASRRHYLIDVNQELAPPNPVRCLSPVGITELTRLGGHTLQHTKYGHARSCHPIGSIPGAASKAFPLCRNSLVFSGILSRALRPSAPIPFIFLFIFLNHFTRRQSVTVLA